jgi:hypothetical protein
MAEYLVGIVEQSPEGNPGHLERGIVGSLLEDKLADRPQAVGIAVGYNSKHNQVELALVVYLRPAG